MATKTKYETTLTLPSDREILMTRKFEAPRETVWETITDPDLIPKWWGFARDTTEVKKMDVRPVAQQRIYQLRSEPFNELNTWLETFRRSMSDRMDRLEDLISERKAKKEREKDHGH